MAAGSPALRPVASHSRDYLVVGRDCGRSCARPLTLKSDPGGVELHPPSALSARSPLSRSGEPGDPPGSPGRFHGVGYRCDLWRAGCVRVLPAEPKRRSVLTEIIAAWWLRHQIADGEPDA